ncbi:HAMP domain-containing protein [Sphaerospermopsis aphanizomenoides BCCUSP55]|uniref:sensor histidine kinase n=1 Tax=Sphaerospermopsis aphanizomenoides TaxID=459663 RepID=UPI001906DF7F|nr:ATP-binding protein [Sphaerospermopsis aphanizomenoides]MBK1986631.1 HAMP domain-containing protein [Sphaerospermopsis aphanizomenoides BCCUSP55]
MPEDQKPTFVDKSLESKKAPSQEPKIEELPTIEFPSRRKLKASSWRIHQKIGYGYFVAIGIGFFGSLTGLVLANYYRGREVRQFNQANEQEQLLNNYKDAVIEAQLHSSNLVAVLSNSEKLHQKKTEFLKSVAQAQKLEQNITGYISSQPQTLAATSATLETLLYNYSTNLNDYILKIENILRPLDTPNVKPEQIEVAREKLLATMESQTVQELDSLSDQLTNILRTAQLQEQDRRTDVEQARFVERTIVIVSMLLSVAVAAVVAWRTSRAIAEPVITVTQVAEQVARKSNFDLRAPITTQDEIGLLAKSLNRLIERVSERTKQLEQAKELAEAASKAKSQFLANVSHELRTPLNAVIGLSQLLKEDAVDIGASPDFITDLETINSAGRHLLELINDILDVSKIEAGKMTLYPETFDIITLINNVVHTVKPAMEKNGNTLIVECDQYLGTMYADQTRMRQVLLNLLSNAAKFTTNGRVTLTVKIDKINIRKEAPLGLIIFTLTDTGIGMSPSQQQQLFKPFIQGDISTTKKYGGTGLGLAISHHFCQMMGGEIIVNSQLGVGSTFRVSLPLT